MATTLQRTNIKVDLSSIVDNAIIVVKNVRITEQARKESEFQKAVASGMSYEAQLEFRKEQLEEERSSSISDSTYITSLETSIEKTKKLSRFENIRNKYKQSLDDYVVGKESISQHISILEDTMSSEQDPGMREEIRDLLSKARTEQSTIELNAIKNRATVANKDRSVALIDASVSEISSRRARAAINKNDDEVAMWDDSLLALKNSKGKLQVENGLNEIAFQTNRANLKSTDKMNLLNGYISSADVSSPLTYDGVSYPSMKAFWENKRGEYINSGYFDEAKKELDAQTKSLAASNEFGQIPVTRINAVNEFYNTLKTRPEFAPFSDKIEQYRADNVSSMVTDLAESIYNEANATGEQLKAQSAVISLENKFGIKVTREPFEQESAAGKGIASDVTKAIEGIGKTPTTTPATETVSGGYIVKEGDSLSRIAANSGVSLNTLLDANPQFKTNPNAIRPGQTVNLPGAIKAPTQVTTEAPVKTEPSIPTPTAPVQPTPTAPTAPTAPTTQAKTEVQAQPLATEVSPATTPKIYVVKPGDTLSQIAERELGGASKAFEIQGEGGKKFDETTARSLQIGTKLILPA